MPKNIRGYEGFGPEKGKFVCAENALCYASEQCGITLTNPDAPDAENFKEMLVEWFFSGNWVAVYEEDDDGE